MQFRLHVGEKNALILLDDVDWGREEVERLLDAAPGCTFVLGSPRRQVWEEGRPIALRGLSTESALALIERRLGRSITPEELPLARSLCGSLEGHPLRLVQAIGLVQDGSKTLREVVAPLRSEAPSRALARRALASCAPAERRVLALLGAMEGLPRPRTPPGGAGQAARPRGGPLDTPRAGDWCWPRGRVVAWPGRS